MKKAKPAKKIKFSKRKIQVNKKTELPKKKSEVPKKKVEISKKKSETVRVKFQPNIMGQMKRMMFKEKQKLPDFKITKNVKLVILPDTKQVDIKYPLIEPFAYTNLKWDKKTEELTYNLIEPELTKEEEKTYDQVVESLLEVLDVELSVMKKTDEAMDYLEEKIQQVINEYEIKISKESYLKIMYFIFRNFVGLNEIEPLMNDPYIEDISCNGVNIPLFVVHRKYGSIKTNIVFSDVKKLRDFIVKIAERTGRFISYAEPLLDGSLPDGSRIQASYASDVTMKGPTFTIRKFTEEPLSPITLMNNGTINSEMLAYLWLAVESGASILVGGGAATGKTTMINILSTFIPPSAKIITIEDTRELNLIHENWIPSVSRAGFMKGYGEVTLFDLLKESFRQSPDYVIVGEVRGEEAYVMFQGMAAGFPCMGTMHAGRVEDVIYRLESPPINLTPSLLETLDIVLIMTHAKEKGSTARRVKEIVEIESVDPKTGTARTNRLYNWLASEDTFETMGYSWMLQEISKLRGTPLEQVKKEVSLRKEVLDKLNKNKVTKFKEVSDIIAEYHRDPEKILKELNIK